MNDNLVYEITNRKYTIGNLEETILSCLLQKPELMENLTVNESHFIYNKAIFIFIKNFYDMYKTLDITLMVSKCANKYKLMERLQILVLLEPIPKNIAFYETELIRSLEEKKEEKENIIKIYNIANKLYLRDIDIEQFVEQVNVVLEVRRKENYNE